MREIITNLFEEMGDHYQQLGRATYEVHQSHDVHAFYRLAGDQTKVIHVQGYPGMSNSEGVRVYARMMDHDRMINIREDGRVSIGNEHDAVIQRFPNFVDGVVIPAQASILRGMLEENCEELKE